MTTLREAAKQALAAMEAADVDPHSSDAVYKAMDALRSALAEPVQEPQHLDPLDMPLEMFIGTLSTRARNAVRAEYSYRWGKDYINPKNTVRNLVMFSRQQLLELPNLGKHSVDEIENKLRTFGLKLRDDSAQNEADELTVAYTMGAQSRMRTLNDEIIAELWHKNAGYHHHFARAIERWLKGEK